MPKITWDTVLKYAFPLGKALLILGIGHFIILGLLRLPKRILNKTKLDQSLINIILKTLNVIGHIVVILSALSTVGISTTGLLAALSAVAVGVALALKDSLSNIAGGILLLLSPRFVTGDYISVGEDEGYVTAIELMHTTIRTYNNRHITFSNGTLINSTVTNYTWEGVRRIDISFPVSYDADIEEAKQTALAVMQAHPLAVAERGFISRVGSYADSAVMLDLRIWCKCDDYWTVYYDTVEQVRVAFTEKGIEIPYNQLDVHFDPPKPTE